jgi:hypothetical protein
MKSYDEMELDELYAGIINMDYDLLKDFWLIMHRLIKLASWEKRTCPKVMAAGVILTFNIMKRRLGYLPDTEYSEFLTILNQYFSGQEKSQRYKYPIIALHLDEILNTEKNEIIISKENETFLRNYLKDLNPKNAYDAEIIKRITNIIEGEAKFIIKIKDEN